MSKPLSDTYLYSKSPDYNKLIYAFITKAERINTKGNEFSDILFDIKRRRVSNSLSKIIVSNNVVVCTMPDSPLPKAFRTFVAKDVKDNNKVKLFIDATQFIKFESGTYICTNLDWLISYILSGMVNYIYAVAPQKLLLDSSVISDGCDCFTRLFSHSIDYMYKITSVQKIKKRIDYMIAMYYSFNLLGKDVKSESQSRIVRNNASKISNIDSKDSKLVDLLLKPDDFDNIKTFLDALSRVCELKDLKIDAFVSTWIKNCGTGTIFALEYFPAFSAMLTNTYIGSYLDNQISIEKQCGPSLVSFVKTILKIGETVV